MPRYRRTPRPPRNRLEPKPCYTRNSATDAEIADEFADWWKEGSRPDDGYGRNRECR